MPLKNTCIKMIGTNNAFGPLKSGMRQTTLICFEIKKYDKRQFIVRYVILPIIPSSCFHTLLFIYCILTLIYTLHNKVIANIIYKQHIRSLLIISIIKILFTFTCIKLFFHNSTEIIQQIVHIMIPKYEVCFSQN